MAQQPLYYTKTIPLANHDKEFLLIQVWTSIEITLKHVKKTESGDLATLSVFKFPFSQAKSVAEALREADTEVSLNFEIQQPIEDLYKKYGKDRVDTVFQRVKTSRAGMPE